MSDRLNIVIVMHCAQKEELRKVKNRYIQSEGPFLVSGRVSYTSDMRQRVLVRNGDVTGGGSPPGSAPGADTARRSPVVVTKSPPAKAMDEEPENSKEKSAKVDAMDES